MVKESLDARAARLQSTATKSRRLALRKKLIKLINDDWDACVEIRDHMLALGRLAPEEEPTTLAIEDDRAHAHGEQQEEIPEGGRLPQWNVGEAIHRNRSRWCQVPPSQIRMILSTLEPLSLSQGNLRSLMKKGMRECPREPLLQLLEFIVGIDPESEVGERRLLCHVVAWMKARIQVQGRVAAELEMPPDWSRDGYYSLSEKAGQLFLEKKNVGKVLAEGLLDGTPKLRDYTIDMNFSEHRAKIRNKTSPSALPVLCALFFGRSVNDARKSACLVMAEHQPLKLQRTEAMPAPIQSAGESSKDNAFAADADDDIDALLESGDEKETPHEGLDADDELDAKVKTSKPAEEATPTDPAAGPKKEVGASSPHEKEAAFRPPLPTDISCQ
jgi:hypothetical protein